MHSIAIKINVSKDDQDTINKAMISSGYAPQKRKFHCTFGFIEKVIPDDETDSFGQKITQLLQEFIDLYSPIYEVEKASHLFGHVIAFEPTLQARLQLVEINKWLFAKVNEVSEGRWNLNKETQPGDFTPHLTLWRARKADRRLSRLARIAETHPIYSLSKAGYVIF